MREEPIFISLLELDISHYYGTWQFFWQLWIIYGIAFVSYYKSNSVDVGTKKVMLEKCKMKGINHN